MGLFSKKKYADTIYYGGTIYTMDEDYPIAEAVAVKDSKIIAVGDFQPVADNLQNNDTVLYDLKNKYMTPGLIDIGCDITPLYLRDLAKKQNEEAEAERKALEEAGLDEEEIEEAEEDSFNEEALPDDFLESPDSELEPAKPEVDALEKALYIRGITTILNLEHSSQGDDYFKNLLMERWQNGSLKQRYFGSVNISRMIDIGLLVYFLEQKRTICNELEGYINVCHVDLNFSSDETAANYMSQEYIEAVSDELAQHNFNVRYVPSDADSAESASRISSDMRDSYKRLSFIVSGDNQEISSLDYYTVEAARALGASKILGSIEEGKYADFAIFESDPLKGFGPAKTIFAGKEIIF